ncbi:MAG: sensor histidine kinase [Erysipelotrichaceae bacterium]
MIRKIRVKFIMIAMVSLFVLLTVIIFTMNAINYNNLVDEADSTIQLISANKGKFPESIDKHIYGEAPFQTRYFSVLTDGTIFVQVDTTKIKLIDSDTAVEYSLLALYSEYKTGFINDYRYLVNDEGNYIRITFLDCNKELVAYRDFLYTSIAISLVGYVVFFFVICLFSNTVLKPVIDSYDKQKQFVTDASHEIKTPLAIIQADKDVLALDNPDNSWLQDIDNQISKLTKLTNDLVFLSKLDEINDDMAIAKTSVAPILNKTVANFVALEVSNNKNIIIDQLDEVFINGSEAYLEKMFSLLIENALKYGKEGCDIIVRLTKLNNNMVFTITNQIDKPIENIDMIFERFYKDEKSHNSGKGGHGIGLSIVKAIVTKHKGKVQASQNPDNMTFTIKVTI